MPTIRKTVGQITLKVLTDVESTTYYYLLVSSMAPAPSKPTTNPPTGGWSTTEPEFFVYVLTQDSTIVPGKDYYTRSGTEGSYTYTKVLEPSISGLSSYYEKIYGDTRSLYVTVQTLYTDNTFDYSQPSLSSSYEAAKEAYNRAKTALDLAGDTKQFFWEQPNAYSTSIPAGIYVTHIPQSQFKVSTGPTQGNIVIQDTGLTIRNGAIPLASLTGTALNFYKPGAGSQAPSLQLSNSALTIYNPSDNARTLMLDSSGLNFYGSNTSTADVTLDSNGLTLLNGSIKSGALVTPEQDGFLYLSPQVYTGTISGHSAGQIPIDSYVKTNWRQIIGTKFAVDSDGNLYANNAHLSNAEVEGAITATSLTIGSGSNVYDGEAAINASGYTIEIIDDVTAAYSGATIGENNTYLYPIMYLNGVKITSGITNTDYIWYLDGATTGGTRGHSSNGGIVAEYGHTYRVTYQFNDSAVGQAQPTLSITVDPSKYITRISEAGITVHPEDTSNNNFLRITANGIDIVKNNITVASYGSDITIGSISGQNVFIDNNGIQLKNGQNTLANFGTTITIGENNGKNVYIDSNGIQIRNLLTTLANFGTSQIQIGADGSSRTIIDTNGLTVYAGAANVAQFGSTSRVGDISGAHSILDTNGQRFYGADGTTLLANIGYGEYSEDAQIYTSPYYTFGTRVAGSFNASKSLVVGDNNIASGYASQAFGIKTTAVSPASTALGEDTVINTYNGMVIGRNNSYDEIEGFNDQARKRLINNTLDKYIFIIGNGTEEIENDIDYIDTVGSIEINFAGKTAPFIVFESHYDSSIFPSYDTPFYIKGNSSGMALTDEDIGIFFKHSSRYSGYILHAYVRDTPRVRELINMEAVQTVTIYRMPSRGKSNAFTVDWNGNTEASGYTATKDVMLDLSNYNVRGTTEKKLYDAIVEAGLDNIFGDLRYPIGKISLNELLALIIEEMLYRTQ